MSEIDELISDLENGHAGDPWHGPSRAAVLANVTVVEAAWRPPGSVHSIWELVLHMTGWTGEVASRVRGTPPKLPPDGDWPAVPAAATEAEWKNALRALDEAHRDLVRAIRGMNSESLGKPVATNRDAPLRVGVTYRAMLRGVAQHDAYHTGQVIILWKLARSERTGSDT
jgi:uncharacterized damage-inducible protein DinB